MPLPVGAVLFIVLSIAPHVSSARVRTSDFIDKAQENSQTASMMSTAECDGEQIFREMMEFNARTRNDAYYELYFRTPPVGANDQGALGRMMLSLLSNKLSDEAMQELSSDHRREIMIPFIADTYEELEDPNSNHVRFVFAGKAGKEMRKPASASWIDELTLGDASATLVHRSGELQDYLEDPVTLGEIMRNDKLARRHRQANGLFSKGFGKEDRPDPAGTDLKDWLAETCKHVSKPEDKLDLAYKASLFSVRNQVFTNGNHRTSMALVGWQMPESVSHTWFNEVVSYAGTMSATREQVYAAMHNPFDTFEVLPPFSSPDWERVGGYLQYAGVFKTWMAEMQNGASGGGGAEELMPENALEHITPVKCWSKRECDPSRGEMCCDPMIQNSTFQCKSITGGQPDCFCATKCVVEKPKAKKY